MATTNEKRKQVNVYFNETTYETVKKLADDDKRSLSNMIEVLVERQITLEGDK